MSWLFHNSSWFTLILSFPILYLCFTKIKLSEKALWILGFVAIILLQIDSLVLGPYSRHEWGDGGLYIYGYFPYLSHFNEGIWLHDLAGGVDKQTIGRFGGEYFSLRRILSEILPFWSVLIFLRILVPFIAFAGIYLFCTRILKVDGLLSFACGVLYAYAWDFNSSLTFYYGLSISGIPFLLYLFYKPRDFDELSKHIGFSMAFFVLYIGFSDPMYWLPLVWVATFSIYFIRKSSISVLLIQLLLLTVLWIINYAEVIYAFFLTLPYSARHVYAGDGTIAGNIFAAFIEHLKYIFSPLIKYNKGGLAFVFPFLVLTYYSLLYPLNKVRIFLVCILILGLSQPILLLVPWDLFQLSFLTKYTWHLELSIFCLVLIGVAYVVSLRHNDSKDLSFLMGVIFLSIACGYWSYTKTQTYSWMIARGSISSLTEISNLKNNEWMGNYDRRFLSLHGKLDRNAIVNYGISNSSVVGTLVNANMFDFWRYSMPNNDGLSSDMLGIYTPTYQYSTKLLKSEDLLDIEWLRIANIGYIISDRPIEGVGIKKVSGPKELIGENNKPATDLFIESIQFDSVYIYALNEPLPLAYQPTRILDVNGYTPRSFFSDKIIEQNVLSGCAYIDKSLLNLQILSETELRDDLVKLHVERIPNGYLIDIYSDRVSSTIINVPYNPWWRARDEKGRELLVLEANKFQTFISVPHSASKIELIYKRPQVSRYLLL